jgi:triacylglycerol esterase/lipase EstA (alpha/beta hydrolase family)
MAPSVSTRTLVRLLLAIQAGFALALAYGLLHFGVLGSWWLALVVGSLTVLLLRVAVTANNFVMTARFASATPEGFRLGPAARVRLFVEEFMATLLQTSWFMARPAARPTIHENSRSAPVLLLHGYGSNSGYWAHLIPLLDAAHISHAALELEPLLGAIDDYVPMVARAVDDLCTKSNVSRVIIVAHSMGGLVARAYLRAHGPAHLAHIFTLGSPHHGTSLANLGPGQNAAQMRRSKQNAVPESAWLQALSHGEDAQARALITSFYTHHDNIVAPQTSSHLPGSRNLEFGGIGHVAMGRNPRILARLMDELLKLCTR